MFTRGRPLLCVMHQTSFGLTYYCVGRVSNRCWNTICNRIIMQPFRISAGRTTYRVLLNKSIGLFFSFQENEKFTLIMLTQTEKIKQIS